MFGLKNELREFKNFGSKFDENKKLKFDPLCSSICVQNLQDYDISRSTLLQIKSKMEDPV